MNFFLYRISNHEQFNLLTQTQFVEKIRSSPILTDWLYWTPGLSEWKPLSAHHEIQTWLDLQWNEKDLPPSLPEKFRSQKSTENSAPSADDFEVVELGNAKSVVSTVIEETQPGLVLPIDNSNSRKFPRVKGRLRTILTNKSKAFITYSKDISMGGIFVETNIPKDMLDGQSEIEVYISDPTGKKSIVFTCHPVGDRENANRFSFSKADGKQLLKLSHWLEDLAKSHVA